MASKCSKLPVVTIFTKYATNEKLFLEAWRKRIGYIPYKFVPVEDGQKPEDSKVKLQDAEILLADPQLIASLFHQLPKTKWVQSTWAGIDGIIKDINPKDLPPPFMFTRLVGPAMRTHMAEYVIGQMIAHERRFYEMKKSQEQKVWDWRDYRPLGRLTFGVIGLGDIGEEIARLCKAFGMRVWGFGRRDLSREEQSKNVDEYRPFSGLAELLADCDYICNVLPKTTATDDLLSGDVLSSCTKQPVFINVGRGNVISEDSILNALDKGWISHAVLDVFRTEPLPVSSPLWSSSKVTITAHCSANAHPEAIFDVLEVNYKRYINGEPLKYTIDWKQGY